MNDMSRTLYVSDLDGTLLTSRTEISAESRRLLNEAIARGAQFTIATARTPATVAGLLRGVEMRLPVVVMTGAALWDTHTLTYSDICTIPPETVARLRRIYIDRDVPTFVYRLEEDRIVIYHSDDLTEQEREFMQKRIGNPFKRFEQVRIDNHGFPTQHDNVVLFYAMLPNERIERAYPEIKQLDVNALMYHDMFGPEVAILEVFGPETSKANAVRRLAQRIGADRIVAFGDNLNDLPMFRIADVAVAVSNAVEEVRRRAHVVIGDHDDDAVARFILNDISNENL